MKYEAKAKYKVVAKMKIVMNTPLISLHHDHYNESYQSYGFRHRRSSSEYSLRNSLVLLTLFEFAGHPLVTAYYR